MKIAYHNRSRLSPELEGGATYLLRRAARPIRRPLPEPRAQLEDPAHHLGATVRKDERRRRGRQHGARRADQRKRPVEALESGKVSSCGLDVFENEPKIEEGLMKNERAFIVPHIGTNTYETQREMELLVIHNLESGVDKGKLLTPIAEQKGKF